MAVSILDVLSALSPQYATGYAQGVSGPALATGNAASALANAINSGAGSFQVSQYAPVAAPVPAVQLLTFVKGWSPSAPIGGLAGIH
jgi:hypothetical protein